MQAKLDLSKIRQAPTIDQESDVKYFEQLYGQQPFTMTQEERVVFFRNTRPVGAPTRPIRVGNHPLDLPKHQRDLGSLTLQLGSDVSLTLDEYFELQSTAGLLVIKDGEIAYERYGLGNSEATLWQSFSITKSVVSMLIGAAIEDGYIRSIDDPVTDYLPQLRGSEYEATSIKNVLQMSSGVQWNEEYTDPNADIRNATFGTLDLYSYLADKGRVGAPGSVFNYNTAETNLAGTLLRAALGNNLSTYLENKIWQPFGMEHEANWLLTEENGGEFGGCCISASLRDYGRLGMFALSNGQLADGTSVLPTDWMKDSTAYSDTPMPDDIAPIGYGYFWWLYPSGAYAAAGIFGQGIYIDPESQLVIAVQSAWQMASPTDQGIIRSVMYESVNAALK